MVILLVFHAGDPSLIPVEGNIFSPSYFPLFYIFYNKSLVAFYINFNALAKSSQPLFIIFKSKRIITVMVTDIRLCQTY